MGNLIQQLFSARADLANTSFNFTPWLIIIGVALFLSWYYWVEGRRKIPWIKNHTVCKQYVFDRMFNAPQVPVWAVVGLVPLGGQFLDTSFFSWRIWLVAWVLWGVGIALFWLVYFVRDFPRHAVEFERFKERAKYLPGRQR